MNTAPVRFSKMPSGGKMAHKVPNPNRSQFTDHARRKCKPTDGQREPIFGTRRHCYRSKQSKSVNSKEGGEKVQCKRTRYLLTQIEAPFHQRQYLSIHER